MTTAPSVETVFNIFKQLNQIPRPSHHEEKVSDFLCQYAEQHGLSYSRDAQNCRFKPHGHGVRRHEESVRRPY